jgi:hypothetical protein
MKWRISLLIIFTIFTSISPCTSAVSGYGVSTPPLHMRLQPDSILRADKALLPRQSNSSSTSDRLPLVVTNNCTDIIHPGIYTQHGSPPESSGFELKPGENRTVTVSQDWQGRVWARTNCTFNDSNQNGGPSACTTGDCGGALDCKMAVSSPAFSLENHPILKIYTDSNILGRATCHFGGIQHVGK